MPEQIEDRRPPMTWPEQIGGPGYRADGTLRETGWASGLAIAVYDGAPADRLLIQRGGEQLGWARLDTDPYYTCWFAVGADGHEYPRGFFDLSDALGWLIDRVDNVDADIWISAYGPKHPADTNDGRGQPPTPYDSWPCNAVDQAVIDGLYKSWDRMKEATANG